MPSNCTIGWRAFVLACFSALGVSCALPATSPSALAALDLVAESAACVTEINRLRATAGLQPLEPSEDLQQFSFEAARVDGESHEIHKFFYMTRGGDFLSSAQNEIPWWSLDRYGSVRQIVREGLASQWKTGPSGDHYRNLAGPYSRVGCGIAVMNGEVTVTHDFR